jgi:hypothetical protein
MTGNTPEDLILPEFPDVALRTWGKFHTLSETRTSGMSGPLPITYSEIKNWMDLSGESISVYELDLVKKIDGLFVRINNGG